MMGPGGVFTYLLPGLATTVELSLVAAALAFALGLVFAIVRVFRVPLVSQAVRLVVNFFRGTPLLVQLYFIFYVFPTFGLTMGARVTGVVGLALYFSAYTSETFRGSILAIPKGQWEAAKGIGLSSRRTWWRVIIPQAVRLVIPPLGNNVIVIFKESALLSAITVNELMARANNLGSLKAEYFLPLSIVGGMYLMISYPAALGIRRLEEYLTRG